VKVASISRLLRAAVLLVPAVVIAAPPAGPTQDAGAPAAGGDAVFNPAITVQIAPPPLSISSLMDGGAGPLGARPVTGKPIAAQFVTEHHQVFADGNRIARSTNSVIYRDSAGRIRRESQLSVPGLSADVAHFTFITIVDQGQGIAWYLNPQEKVAHRYELNGSGPSYVARVNAKGNGVDLLPLESAGAGAKANAVPRSGRAGEGIPRGWRERRFATNEAHGSHSAPHPSAAPVAMVSNLSGAPVAESATPKDDDYCSGHAMELNEPLFAAPYPVRTENLGVRRILGFRARGTRVITTLPAGKIGNDRPINIVSEQWYSPRLELVLRSMHRDPWGGEIVTRITRIRRGEQPASRFEIPSSYKIVDAANDPEHRVLDVRGGRTPGMLPW
jgi:hypothetical protein